MMSHTAMAGAGAGHGRAGPGRRAKAAGCAWVLVAASVALASTAAANDDWRVANLNVLHGLGCNPDSCRAADRIDLLFRWIEDAGCPDIVTLQEINNTGPGQHVLPLILAGLPTLCGGVYDGNTAYSGVNDLDEEMVLAREPIVHRSVRRFHNGLAGFYRHALHVRIDGGPGEVDVFTTHLAAGVDNGSSACDVDSNGDMIIDIPCPDECNDAGAATVRQCQVVQLVAFVESQHSTLPPAIVTGDFNAEPSSAEYAILESHGWLDTHLAVGNSECQADTGVGCTSGRSSSSTAELESTAANVDRRIDYAFLAPGAVGAWCVYTLDGPGDDDADGTATRIFADVPNPFDPSCGASPDPICWPSDHEGNELDMNLFNCGSEPIPTLSPGGIAAAAGLLWLAAISLARLRGRRVA